MTNDTYWFSSRAGDMDRKLIHAWLSKEAYWAQGRTRALQDAAIDASINFGMFDSMSGRQVAYARVVTDSVTFAWLCDVFVDPKIRGHGVGVALMKNVCSMLDDLNLKRVILSTGDAHGLYEKFGFEPLAQPEKWMARTAPIPAISTGRDPERSSALRRSKRSRLQIVCHPFRRSCGRLIKAPGTSVVLNRDRADD